MVPFAIGVSATIGNGTWCQLVAPSISVASIPTTAVTGGTQYGQYEGSQFDIAAYSIQLNSGVTAGTATFQELFADLVTWIPIANPAPISLVFATTPFYTGLLNGPFLGIRIVISGLTGGTIGQILLKSSVRSI